MILPWQKYQLNNDQLNWISPKIPFEIIPIASDGNERVPIVCYCTILLYSSLLFDSATLPSKFERPIMSFIWQHSNRRNYWTKRNMWIRREFSFVLVWQKSTPPTLSIVHRTTTKKRKAHKTFLVYHKIKTNMLRVGNIQSVYGPTATATAALAPAAEWKKKNSRDVCEMVCHIRCSETVWAVSRSACVCFFVSVFVAARQDSVYKFVYWQCLRVRSGCMYAVSISSFSFVFIGDTRTSLSVRYTHIFFISANNSRLVCQLQ